MNGALAILLGSAGMGTVLGWLAGARSTPVPLRLSSDVVLALEGLAVALALFCWTDAKAALTFAATALLSYCVVRSWSRALAVRGRDG